MKRSLIIIALLIVASSAMAESSKSNQWWSYLASYDNGPGSIRLDLAMRKQAPVAGYPNLVVTGPTYASKQKQGLPEISDFKRLDDLQEKIVAAISKQSPYIYVGTFTHNFEQLHYIYVKDTSGVEQALASVYREFCPGCKIYTNIKNDAAWSAYSDFLFPNQATRDHYGLKIK